MSGFYHLRLVRFFIDQQGIADIGQLAGLLVILVGLEQDRRRGDPVCWAIVVVMEKLSVSSRKSFFSARKLAIKSGWLKYQNRGKRAGHYQIARPTRYDDDYKNTIGVESEPHEIPDQNTNRDTKQTIHAEPISTIPQVIPKAESEVLSNETTRQKNERKRLLKCLTQMMVAKTDTAIDEWIALTEEIAECEDFEEGLNAIRWMVRKARKEGLQVYWPRDVVGYGPSWIKYWSVESRNLKMRNETNCKKIDSKPIGKLK